MRVTRNIFRIKSFAEQWDVNKPTGRHSTLLTAACCQNGDTINEIIKILLEKGANPNVLDKDKDTPLLLSIKRKNYEAVKMLIEHGADVNLEGHITPIMYILCNVSFADRDYGILSYESQEIIDSILPKCDPNQICRRGYSPLIYAANFEDMNTLFKLIEMGADYSYVYSRYPNDFWHYLNDRNRMKIKDKKDELIARNKVFEGFYNYLYDKGYLSKPKPISKEDEKNIRDTIKDYFSKFKNNDTPNREVTLERAMQIRELRDETSEDETTEDEPRDTRLEGTPITIRGEMTHPGLDPRFNPTFHNQSMGRAYRNREIVNPISNIRPIDDNPRPIFIEPNMNLQASINIFENRRIEFERLTDMSRYFNQPIITATQTERIPQEEIDRQRRELESLQQYTTQPLDDEINRIRELDRQREIERNQRAWEEYMRSRNNPYFP